ncbi:hypothetical protein [Stenotrophomonas tumulicola]|uniref:Flagellar FliJ protein n=1 Tax=Stenotrophomonas tumulicola TaxID=1685415 RepID=A0A7W3IHN5_9GAMM|nr:hypothetical protein [Stenotrophomonas tumulicola]MBA8682057.1 hypothetical protein [Stenotrophomonas tumulicola]
MPSPNEANGRRLIKLKQVQQQMARVQAQAQRRDADGKRDEANQLRLQAVQTVQLALPQPEQGLTLAALYTRLRSLAVARAHAVEVGLAAAELEAEAVACDAHEQALRAVAAKHQRKQARFEHWQQVRGRLQSRCRLRRQELQQQEDFPCRRFPR